MTAIAAQQFRNILLIKPSSLGDCLHALPVLNALGQALPRARISWLINREYAELFKNHPALDAIIVFNRRSFSRLNFSLPQAADFWRDLRRGRFDLVIDLQGLLRSGLMSLASGAPVRLGLSDARELAGVFYTHRTRLRPTDVHAVDRYLRCLETLGIAAAQPDFSLPLSPACLAGVDRMLTQANLPPPGNFLLAVPGARWESKRWPADRFAALIDRFAGELALPGILAGTSSEITLCRRIAELCRSKPVNWAGKTSLPELAGLIKRSRLVLGHDSGTIHLAAALDKPLVCLIGPTDPARTGPYRRKHSILSTRVPCAPCRRTVCDENICMTGISVQDVFARVRNEMENPGRPDQ